MDLSHFNQLINSLTASYIRGRHLDILQSVRIEDFKDINNVLIYLHKGTLGYGKGKRNLEEGEVLFIPENRVVELRVGKKKRKVISSTNKGVFREKYFTKSNYNSANDSISIIAFETKLFNSFSFFDTANIPPFVITKQPKLIRLVRELIRERIAEEAGYRHCLELHIEKIIIEILRYIHKNELFETQLSNQRLYFNDSRLTKVFTYIQQNLEGDLSNRILADIANTSEEYIGHFFKRTTGINPQEFVENQRLEKSVELLRSTSKGISEIAEEVGYSDSPYFCRRFKIKYGLSAGKMRKLEDDS